MKIVNCVHCGTPNFVEEKAFGVPRCVKCGRSIQLGDSLLEIIFSVLPEKTIKHFVIGSVIAFLLATVAFFAWGILS